MTAFAVALLTACAEAPTFAVLDGAQFDNLPDALREGEFVARSLYLDRGDNNPDQVITAPHLVLLDERPATVLGRAPEQTVPALMALLEGKPAAVFWQCPTGEEALFKHLRGINMVLYPKSALPPADVSDDKNTDDALKTHELVLFRHADANALAQVYAAVTVEEKARLYGPAQALLFKPSEDWSTGPEWSYLPRPEDLPPPRPGSLTLSEATAERLSEARVSQSQKKIVQYLQNVAPEQTAAMGEAQLNAQTRYFMDDGKQLGLKSEAALGRWCYLEMITGGHLGRDPETRRFLTMHGPELHPDQRVRVLLKETARALDETGT